MPMTQAIGASDLVVVNPAMVLGPVLDGDLSTSSEVVRQMLLGAVPVLPPVHYAMVDVRDLSALQVAAMDAPEAGGRRLIASHEQPVTFGEIAGMLREALGAQAAGAPRRTLPLWLAKLFAKFDPKLGLVVADLALTEAFRRDGALLRIDSSYVTRLTGVRFRSPRESVLDCARSLLAAGAAGNRGAR
jgi:nucleoside-diphosphate-sugar epimerase